MSTRLMSPTPSSEPPIPPVYPSAAPPASLKSERIQLFLDENPGWTLESKGRALRRTFRLATDEAALAFLRIVRETAQALERRPEVRWSGLSVEILVTAKGKALAARDLEFCRALGFGA